MGGNSKTEAQNNVGFTLNNVLLNPEFFFPFFNSFRNLNCIGRKITDSLGLSLITKPVLNTKYNDK